MSTKNPGAMIREAMDAKGLSKRRLGALIGVLQDGTIVDASGIRLIVEGRRRSYTTELVTRIVDVLEIDRLKREELIDFDADDLYEACGVWPDGFTAESLRKVRAETRDGTGALHQVRTTISRRAVGARILAFPAQASRVPTRPVAKVA